MAVLGETSIYYPGNDFLTNYSSTLCFNSNCQNRLFNSETIMDIQNNTDICLVDYQQWGSPSEFFWRNYYLNHAWEIPKSTETYTTPAYNSLHLNNPLVTMVHPQDSTLGPTESSHKCTNSKSVRIWRPFSPSPPDSEKLTAGFQFTAGFTISSPINHRINSSFPISSKAKFGHSKSSMFTPFKKKKTFSCAKCLLTFHSSLQLNSHSKVHKGMKPFACDYPNCSKNFARNEELTRHRRIHSGYKPYICGICRKCFGRKDHLSKHLKTHLQASEKKIYVCCVSGCGHRYTRSDALTRHKSTAHGIFKSRNGGTLKKEKDRSSNV